MRQEGPIAGKVNTVLVGEITSIKTGEQVNIFLFGQPVTQEELSGYLDFVNQVYYFLTERTRGSVLELTRHPGYMEEDTASWPVQARNKLGEMLVNKAGESMNEAGIAKIVCGTNITCLFMSWIQLSDETMVCQLEFAPAK